MDDPSLVASIVLLSIAGVIALAAVAFSVGFFGVFPSVRKKTGEDRAVEFSLMHRIALLLYTGAVYVGAIGVSVFSQFYSKWVILAIVIAFIITAVIWIIAIKKGYFSRSAIKAKLADNAR